MRQIVFFMLLTGACFGQSNNVTATKIRAEESLRVGTNASQKVTGFDTTMPGSPTDTKLPTSKCVFDWVTGGVILSGATAGGDLNGSFPSPTVDGLQGRPISGTAPSPGQVLTWSGSQWVPSPVEDQSSTNELQILSISGQNLSLSNGGGTVEIPAGADGNGVYSGSGTIPNGTIAALGTSGDDFYFSKPFVGDIQNFTGVVSSSTNYYGAGLNTAGDGYFSFVSNFSDGADVGSQYLVDPNGMTISTYDDGAELTNVFSLGPIGLRSQGGALKWINQGIHSTQSNNVGVHLLNETAAEAGQVEYSPPLRFLGSALRTSNGLSQTVDFRSYIVPANGVANPTGTYVTESSIAGGAYSRLTSLTSSGKLGIGTTTPAVNLHVIGGMRVQEGLAPDGDRYVQFGGSGFEYRDENGIGTFNMSDDGWINFETGAGRALNFSSTDGTFFSGGNVGIGTTTPEYKLDIQKDGDVFRAGTTDSYVVFNSGDSAAKFYGVSNGNGAWGIGSLDDIGPFDALTLLNRQPGKSLLLATTSALSGSDGNGGAIELTGGEGDGTGNGGSISFTGGAAGATGIGGAFGMSAGQGGAIGGSFSLQAGGGGQGGNFGMSAGQSFGSGQKGGGFFLTAGDSDTGDGGDFTLVAGGGGNGGGSITFKPGPGTLGNGSVRILDPMTNTTAIISTASLTGGGNAEFILPNQNSAIFNTVTSAGGAPGSTPVALGQTYIDTAAGKVYISVGTSSSADWKILN